MPSVIERLWCIQHQAKPKASTEVHWLLLLLFTRSCPTLFDPMGYSMPGFLCPPLSPRMLKLISIESVMSSSHLILCCPLLLLPSIIPSIRVFSNESAFCIRWPKYWSFSFSTSPSVNIQNWLPLGWTGFISWQSKGFSRVFSSTTVWNPHFFVWNI